MDIGARLKEERIAKGLSLEELQEITKIQKRYLVAIEEGKLEILPGKFYARAFMKEYAAALGMDSSELLEEHKEEIPKVEEDDSVIQYSRMERSRNENKGSNFFSVFPKIIVILLVVGILFVLFYFIRTGMSDNEEVTSPNDENDSEIIINNPGDVSEEDTNQEDKDNTNVNEPETADEDSTGSADETGNEEDVEQEGEFTVVEEGTGSSPESTLEFTYSGEEVIVVLEALEGRTWLDVEDANGNSYYSSNFSEDNSPEEIDLSDAGQIYFNVGNVKALKISINGVELE